MKLKSCSKKWNKHELNWLKNIHKYSSNKIRKTQWAPEHRLSKFEQSIIVNLMPISWLFWVYTNCFFYLETTYWSKLNHLLMANGKNKISNGGKLEITPQLLWHLNWLYRHNVCLITWSQLELPTAMCHLKKIITICEDFVSFGYFFEFCGRQILLIWIFVWMPF